MTKKSIPEVLPSCEEGVLPKVRISFALVSFGFDLGGLTFGGR